jgi:hypothetical protein
MKPGQLATAVVAAMIALGVGAKSGRAIAAPQAPIVVEEYESAPPVDAAMLTSPLFAELSARGYVGGEQLAALVGDRLSAPAGNLSSGQLVEAQKQVEAGYQRFIDGDYEKALATEQKAIAAYESAPGSLAGQDALRDLEYRAMLIAARSAQALGRDGDAFAIMGEAVRAFPDRTPSSAQYDPSVSALHHQVAAQLARQGLGSLEVRVDDASAVIFVDERYVGVGRAKLDNLVPGHYRVYIAKADQPGRVHEIDVPPARAASVSASWTLDGRLRTREGRLVIADADDEHGAAVQLARALGASQVIVLTLRSLNGRRAVAGYAIEVDSQHRTFAAVQIEPSAPPADTMKRLAALLAGEHGVSDADLITTEPPKPIIGTPGLGRRRRIALVVGGVGLASLLAGGGFELSSRSDYDASKVEGNNDKQNALYDSANRKYQLAQGFAIVGVACVAAAGYLWFTGHYETEAEQPGVTIAPAATPDGISLIVAGSF